MKRRTALKLFALFGAQAAYGKMSLFDVDPVTDNFKTVISYAEPIEIIEPMTIEPITEEVVAKVSRYEHIVKKKKIYGKRNRKINLYNQNTKEHYKGTYYKNGKYVTSELNKINHFLRDFRQNEVAVFDLNVIEKVHRIQNALSKKRPLVVLSGYRSKKTNEKLRKRTRGVAKNSYHLRAKAIDITPASPTRANLNRTKKYAKTRQIGGVGYYKRSRFVHVDSGPVRSWNG